MASPKDFSEDIVKERTGKTSAQWKAILDKIPVYNHTAAARMLREKHKLSPWWAQAVTIRYEWQMKRRTPKGLKKF